MTACAPIDAAYMGIDCKAPPPLVQDYFKVVGGRTMHVRRKWDGANLVIVADTLDRANAADGVNPMAMPMWRYTTVMPFKDGLLHGRAVRNTYQAGVLYETVTAMHVKGVQHGESTRATDCASLTGKYQWRFTERRMYENGVVVRIESGFKSVGERAQPTCK